MITALDHVNIRTTDLDGMIAWYAEFLGMHRGPRPPFGFPGAWLYAGDQAMVHLVGVSGEVRAGGDITLEHFAVRATGMAAFLSKLTEAGIAHSVDPVPDFPTVQVNLRDPDGNHIHVDFDKSEMA